MRLPIINYIFLFFLFLGVVFGFSTLFYLIRQEIKIKKIFKVKKENVDQEQIVLILEELAEIFYIEASYEISLKEKGKLKDIKKQKKRLKKAKKNFWRAHKLAKSLGFKVKKSYKAYLPEYMNFFS